MSFPSRRSAGILATGLLTAALVGGCKAEQAAPEQQAAVPVAKAAEAAVRQVEPSLVCMVNDQFMGVKQIPVAVGDKTYFGCCAMCEGRLNAEASVRVAIDPVSGREVDKARAVIGALPDGAVRYFENADNLRLFAASQS